MADETDFHGTWKIVECVSLAGNVEPTGIEGTTFNLDESGDISWNVPDDAEAMPFFQSETFEVSTSVPMTIKLIGSFAGHIIEFKLDITDDLMLWSYEGCCIIQCQRLSGSSCQVDVPFSFLPALEEGYFSDRIIRCDNGKEFKVHQIILTLAAPEIDWSKSPSPICGLNEEVTHTILYYLYSECLPKGLSEEMGRQCLKATKKLPGFDNLTKLCDTFLKNTALKQQIVSLVTDIHACVDRVIDMFNGKVIGSDGQISSVDTSSLISNPARLCYIIKQGLREGAVAGAKLLILCDLFSRRKGELSREERHEIIKYAKSRLPIFMNQFHRFLEVCRTQTSSMTATQRQEIATYLVPEIESSLDTVSTYIVEMKTALEHVINQSSSDRNSTDKADKPKKGTVSNMLTKTLRNALHLRELKKLKTFHEQTTQNFQNLMQKKQDFCLMTQEEKERSVAKVMEHLLDELPLCLVRIEELISALDDKLTWRDWKYIFKKGSSKVAWVLNKVQSHVCALEPLLRKACDMVHRDLFAESLCTLGLLTAHPSGSDASSSSGSAAKPITSTKYAQLSAVESLCVPPYPSESVLAARAKKLLSSDTKADMVFEIVSVQESGDLVIDHVHGDSVSHTDRQKEVDICHVPAHCVIMAARCDWFRRALLSGMRESIDKRMTVHETSPQLFSLLLEYVYTGVVDTQSLSTEQLAELMALSDRYETDALKVQCERALKHHIDDDSALFLLGLADQYNARILRGMTMNYVAEHQHVIESDIFRELPDHLQAAITDNVELSGFEAMSGRVPTVETPSSMSSTSEMDELMHQLELGGSRGLYGNQMSSTSSSSDDLQYVEDSNLLESCIADLRGIVGNTVPREELVRISLAADYDANRALNFFYS